MEIFVLAFYISICAVLLIYSIVEFTLLLNFLFRKQKHSQKNWDELPYVTIQLPMFNEAFVVERLLDQIVKMDYPKAKLEIQVLDDSNDETVDKAKVKVEFYRKQGIDIQYITREKREGFKAGALDFGLKTAKGEFVAIFDADFLPTEDFLLKALPYFVNEKVGVVQSRWTYVNEHFSLLTRLQTIMLNTHFYVEHAGRNRSGAYINFNGTAGIWRKECISDAGGWLADTLTEDLDLSFRAQTRGWEFVYAMEIESPSELPITFPGYKTQQFRWAKGAAECAKKNIPGLWKSKKSSFWAKLIGSFHLLNSSVFLIVLSFIILSFPLTNSLHHLPKASWIFNIITAFMVSNVLLLAVFFGGNIGQGKNKLVSGLLFPFTFISFLIVNMGVSLYMSLGVIEGYLGKKSDFVRTPKFNVIGKTKSTFGKYARVKITPLLVMEALFVVYGIFQINYAYGIGDVFAVVFASMFAIGFGYNVGSTVYYSTRKS